MTDYVQQERPRDTVVVERDEHDHPAHSSNTGLIVALVILGIIVLLIIFGGDLFGGGGSDVNIQAPTPTGQ